MKKLIFIFALLSLVCKIYAQDFTISFQPKVSATPIDSILAINLRTNQGVKLSGGESLVLMKTTTSINPLQDNLKKEYIFPNPTVENATLCFSTDKGQQVELRLYNANGLLLNQNRQYLAQGTHRFELKFPVTGIYFVSLLKSDVPASIKAVYTGRKIQTSAIEYAGSEKINSQKLSITQLKSATTDQTLAYSKGDVIQYTFFSGVNTTIVSETPITNKVIDVEFVSCIDLDNKSYKVVQIGTQWWMAENLAYLPTVSPPTIASPTEPFYYVYDFIDSDISIAKSTANYATYGVLYNWTAAKAACPSGWHLPSDDEWKQMEMYLGMTQAHADIGGGNVRGTDQGAQLKASKGWSDNGSGTNSSGFAALPSGYRGGMDTFYDLGNYGIWWTSTVSNKNTPWYRFIGYNGSFIGRYDMGGGASDGKAVRCVKD